MSKKGEFYALKMATWVLQHNPQVSKEKGTLSRLVKQFQPQAEILAELDNGYERIETLTKSALAQAKKNDVLLKKLKDIVDRAQAVDDLAFQKAEMYANDGRMPSDQEIKQKVQDILTKRHSNGRH